MSRRGMLAVLSLDLALAAPAPAREPDFRESRSARSDGESEP